MQLRTTMRGLDFLVVSGNLQLSIQEAQFSPVMGLKSHASEETTTSATDRVMQHHNRPIWNFPKSTVRYLPRTAASIRNRRGRRVTSVGEDVGKKNLVLLLVRM